MSRRVILRAGARKEIRAAAEWYDEESPGLGERFARELRSVMSRIGESPLQFAGVGANIRRATLRHFPYFIYFLIASDTRIVVFAVLHHRRQPELWRGRLR